MARVALEDGATNITLIDGQYIDLYEGVPKTGRPVQSIRFNASDPRVVVFLDATKVYTAVVRGPGAFEMIVYPNAAPPGDKAFSSDFDGSFA